MPCWHLGTVHDSSNAERWLQLQHIKVLSHTSMPLQLQRAHAISPVSTQIGRDEIKVAQMLFSW